MTNKEYFYWTLYQVLNDDGINYLTFIPIGDYKFNLDFKADGGTYPIKEILFNEGIDISFLDNVNIKVGSVISGKFNVTNIFNTVFSNNIGLGNAMVFGFSEESGLKNKYIVVGGVGNAKDFGINQKTKFNVKESISFYVRNGNSFEINWTTELSNAYAMDMKVALIIVYLGVRSLEFGVYH